MIRFLLVTCSLLEIKAYFYFPRFSKPDVWVDHIIKKESIADQLNKTFASQN